MSDQTIVEPTPPLTPTAVTPAPVETIQPPTPTENEQGEGNANPPKAGIAQKVRAAASRVISQAGFSFKKGKGRPKNCVSCDGMGCESCNFTGKMPGKLDKPIADEPAELPQPVPVSFPAVAGPAGDSSVSGMFRKACVSSIKGILGILKAVVSGYAAAAGLSPQFTAKTLAKAEPEPGAMEDFTESLDAVMKKRGIQPENAEEWALVLNGLRLVAPYGLLIAEFRGEIARQREERFSHARREREKEDLRNQ